MRIAAATPSVAPHVQETVMAYAEAGYLQRFYTSLLYNPAHPLFAALKKFSSVDAELKRRSFPGLPVDKYAARMLPELIRSIAARKLNPLITDFIWEWAELGFDRWVARSLNPAQVDTVHTYEHAALATLQRAETLNLFKVYEQSSVHYSFFKQIARQQLSLYPELNTKAIDLKVNQKADRRNLRRDEERRLADLVICNSSFTKSTLTAQGTPAEKIAVVPLAFPAVMELKTPCLTPKPLVFLHAGNQSLTKASHLLYQAWRQCNFREQEAELWLIGKMQLPESFRSGMPGKVVIKANVPHSEMMNIYKEADVLILPSLADGFGMVITEAMSRGLPVIASANSGGPDIIAQGEDGWIIPAGNAAVLAGQMKWCVQHTGAVTAAGHAARQKAALYQWPQYRKKLSDLVFDQWQQFQEKKSV